MRFAAGLKPETPVTQAMIPLERIDPHKLIAGAQANDVKLSELYNAMQTKKRHRIPILNSDDHVLYAVHDSTIDKFAGSLQPPQDPKTFDRTMEHLLEVPEFKALVEAIGFVPSDATVAEARAEMGRIPNCNDVFVTRAGKREEPILGWLTNTDLASKVAGA